MELLDITEAKILLTPPFLGIKPVLCPISHTQTKGQAGQSQLLNMIIVFFFLFFISNVTATRTKCSIAGSGMACTGGDQAGSGDTGQGQGEALCLLPTHTSSLLSHPLILTSQVALGVTLSQEAHPWGYFVERLNTRKRGKALDPTQPKRKMTEWPESGWTWPFNDRVSGTSVSHPHASFLTLPFPEFHSRLLSGLPRTRVGRESPPLPPEQGLQESYSCST